MLIHSSADGHLSCFYILVRGFEHLLCLFLWSPSRILPSSSRGPRLISPHHSSFGLCAAEASARCTFSRLLSGPFPNITTASRLPCCCEASASRADSLLPRAADGETEARRGSVTAYSLLLPLVSLSPLPWAPHRAQGPWITLYLLPLLSPPPLSSFLASVSFLSLLLLPLLRPSGIILEPPWGSLVLQVSLWATDVAHTSFRPLAPRADADPMSGL